MGFMTKIKRGFSKTKDFLEDASFKANQGIMKAKEKYNEQQEISRIRTHQKLDKQIAQQKEIQKLTRKQKQLNKLKSENEKYKPSKMSLGLGGLNMGLQDPELNKRKKKPDNLFDLGL